MSRDLALGFSSEKTEQFLGYDQLNTGVKLIKMNMMCFQYVVKIRFNAALQLNSLFFNYTILFTES